MAKRKPDRARFPESRNRGLSPPSAPRYPKRPAGVNGPGSSGRQDLQWIYGVHPALAALANPRRRVERLLLTEEAERALGGRIAAARSSARAADAPEPQRQVLPRTEIERLLPRGAVHQGVALLVGQLPEPALEEVLAEAEGRDQATLVVLDQVTDPQNVGAILRAAAAFGALGVVVTERHAPGATAALAKAASGAIEVVPLVRVTNLARALETLKSANFWCAGLDASAPASLAEADLSGRIALVMGAEGEGLRRLTRAHCDLLLRIPMAQSGIASLNVATAAAVVLYEVSRGRR